VESMIEYIIKNNDIDYDTINKLFAKKDIERINSLIGSQIWDLKQAKLWTIKD
jgi:hypothetical protein